MKLDLPLLVKMERKTKKPLKIYLNLNSYRNTHYQTLNKAKVQYANELFEQIEARSQILEPPLKCTYTLFPQSKRRIDLGNVLSIVQKFTEDALVTAGIITDDDSTIITEVSHCIGPVDKDNPRVELLIEEIRCSS